MCGSAAGCTSLQAPAPRDPAGPSFVCAVATLKLIAAPRSSMNLHFTGVSYGTQNSYLPGLSLHTAWRRLTKVQTRLPLLTLAKEKL